MPGAHRTLHYGPDTYKVSAAVTGGQLVEADASNPGLVKPAASLSKTVLGIALGDAAPVAADADPLLISAAQPEVAVAWNGDVDVTYTAACLMGALLIAGAAGTVTTYVTGTNTYDQIVGRCTATVSGAGLGRMRLTQP
jgi:hypothetical protein